MMYPCVVPAARYCALVERAKAEKVPMVVGCALRHALSVSSVREGPAVVYGGVHMWMWEVSPAIARWPVSA